MQSFIKILSTVWQNTMLKLWPLKPPREKWGGSGQSVNLGQPITGFPVKSTCSHQINWKSAKVFRRYCTNKQIYFFSVPSISELRKCRIGMFQNSVVRNKQNEICTFVCTFKGNAKIQNYNATFKFLFPNWISLPSAYFETKYIKICSICSQCPIT